MNHKSMMAIDVIPCCYKREDEVSEAPEKSWLVNVESVLHQNHVAPKLHFKPLLTVIKFAPNCDVIELYL